MVNFNGDADKIPFYETFEFTRENIAHILQYMGLANAQESCQIEHMDKFKNENQYQIAFEFSSW